MKIGSNLLIYPSNPGGDGLLATAVKATVIYIHPLRRFFVVSWREKYGRKRTETIYYPARLAGVNQIADQKAKRKVTK